MGLGIPSPARGEELVLSLSSSSVDSAAIQDCIERVERQLAHPKLDSQMSVRSLLEGAEREAALALGAADLVEARIVESTPEASRRLLLCAAEKGLGVERNQVGVQSASLPTTLSDLQWGLRNLGIPQRVDLDDLTRLEVSARAGEDLGVLRAPPESGRADRRVIVAILDTGVDLEHPGLKGKILRKEAECQALERYRDCIVKEGAAACDPRFATEDHDGNGYPMDCAGWNLTAGRNAAWGLTGSPETQDELGHGTHVAGVVGLSSEALGLRGVAENVALLPVKVIRSAPNQPIRPQDSSPALPGPNERELRWPGGFADGIARGMLYALRSGAQVINLSLAWPQAADSPLMARMARLARDRGVLVVAAAGNDAADTRVFPCRSEGVVCVAAHGPDGKLAHFSNHGPFVDVAAPGLAILSSWPMSKRANVFTAYQGYEYKNGTSMAAPFVAGALARLLEAGIPADEARARLLVSTRSGNADLPAAFRAEPQTHLVPATKSVLSLSWDRSLGTPIPFQVSLRNSWAASSGAISLHARVTDPRAAVKLLPEVAPGEGPPRPWSAGETRTLQLELSVLDLSVSGRLTLELTAEDGLRTQLIRLPLELSVKVGPELQQGSLLFSGHARLPDAELRSVTPADGSPQGRELLAISRSPTQWRLQLLQVGDGEVVALAPFELTPPSQDLLLIQRLGAELSLAFRVPPTQGQPAPTFQFVFLDSSGSVTRTLSHDNQVAVLHDRFQWIQGPDRLPTPAWIAVGTTPEADKPAPDLWNRDPQDPPSARLYRLSPGGIRLIPIPALPDQDRYPIQLLAQSLQEKARGETRVLLAEGSDFQVKYLVSTLRLGKLSAQPEPLKLDRFRSLGGLTDIQAAVDLNPAQPESATRSATALSGPSRRGVLRTSWLLPSEKKDTSVAPPAVTDSVVRSAGAFFGQSGVSLFAQSHTELIYQDERSGQVRTARTSLERFSFLPTFIFSRTFFPVAVGYGTEERTPGILIPEALGASDASEVVIPEESASGLTLARPAWLRLKAAPGCEGLANPVLSQDESASSLVFDCGDRLVRVEIALPR